MIVLAVDPGAKTGLALYGKAHPAGAACLCDAVTLAWGEDGAAVKAQLKAWASVWHPYLVAVEIPRAGGAAFGCRLAGSNARRGAAIQRNVMGCYVKAESLAGYCEGLGLDVVRKEPTAGNTKRANSVNMWHARFPNFQGQTSEHSRDAALLAQRVYNASLFMSRIPPEKH